jgi:uncharacterized protein with NRDE domain
VLSLQPGVGAVSNADFNTPWSKLQKLKQGLQKQTLAGCAAVADLLPLLQDKTLAADTDLPHTGVSLELERLLSAIFVASERYGTRACSIVVLDQTKSWFFEQSHGERGMLSVTQQFFTP